MSISSQELNQLSMLEINDNILLNVPKTVKIELFNNIIKGTANNPCLEFLTADYIGNILLKVHNKSAALCIFNRLYKYTIPNITDNSCKEKFYIRASKAISSIDLSKCPYMGICPDGGCERRFKINEDFLNSMTAQTKISLYDKMMTHFINEKNYCFLCFSMLILIDYLNESMLPEKAKQLEDMTFGLTQLPTNICKEIIKKFLNQGNKYFNFY